MIQPPSPSKACLWPSRWIWIVLYVFPHSTTRRDNSFTRRIVLVDVEMPKALPISTCWAFCELDDATNLSDCQQHRKYFYPRLFWVGTWNRPKMKFRGSRRRGEVPHNITLMIVHNLQKYDGNLRVLPLQINPKDRLGAADDQVTIRGDSVVLYAACWAGYVWHGLMAGWLGR